VSADEHGALDSDLGPGPSVLGDDPNAAELRTAGYELTDFAGAFTAGARFQVSVGTSGATIVRGPVAIERIGSLRIDSGRASAFDPLDKTRIDRSGLKLDRGVPVGDHPVFVSRHDDVLLAALVRFSGARPVQWTPARLFEAEVEPSAASRRPPDGGAPDTFGFFTDRPRPHTRSRTRFAFAIADSAVLDDVLARVMVPPSLEEINKMRALFGGAPLRPGDPVPGKKSPTGSHPALDALRHALARGATAASHGIVALVEDQPVTSFWGLDAHGHVAALACDLEKLRARGQEVIDVPLVDLHLSLRVAIAGLTLYDHPSHVLVVAPRSLVVQHIALVDGGSETSLPMRTVRREDGSREHELTVPADQRTRGTLRVHLGGVNRPATRM